MQRAGEVRVIEVRDDDDAGRPVGSAVLVTPGVAVMAVDDRESTPSLPLRVLVPVAAGGDRDEQPGLTDRDSTSAVEVHAVHPAADGSAYVVLELEPPRDTRNGGLAALSAHALDTKTPTADWWWCRIWPRICR